MKNSVEVQMPQILTKVGISLDDAIYDCGISKVAALPTEHYLKALEHSMYFLTQDSFFYYSTLTNKLQPVFLESGDLEKLHLNFPNAIAKLDRDQLSIIEEITANTTEAQTLEHVATDLIPTSNLTHNAFYTAFYKHIINEMRDKLFYYEQLKMPLMALSSVEFEPVLKDLLMVIGLFMTKTKASTFKIQDTKVNLMDEELIKQLLDLCPFIGQDQGTYFFRKDLDDKLRAYFVAMAIYTDFKKSTSLDLSMEAEKPIKTTPTQDKQWESSLDNKDSLHQKPIKQEPEVSNSQAEITPPRVKPAQDQEATPIKTTSETKKEEVTNKSKPYERNEKEAVPYKEYLTKINGLLKVFEDDITKDKESHDREAQEEAEELVVELKKYRGILKNALLLASGPKGWQMRNSAIKQFKENCQNCIANARPILENDLSLSQKLENLWIGFKNVFLYIGQALGSKSTLFAYKESQLTRAAKNIETNINKPKSP